MQLYLKEGVHREIAMNKPPDDEMWPKTRAVEFSLWPRTFPDGMEYPGDKNPSNVEWELQKLDGAEMHIDFGGSPKKVFDRVALIWSVHETHRTHCPRCGEKIKGSPWFLSADFGGHEAFLCPADKDFDDRFPRNW